jgi:DNA-directed RNA polymerase subunit RPC12/RpoP
MEEMRSFGYICPKCGKSVVARRSRFALSAAAARIECECGGSTMEVQTDGRLFRLWVPCGLCGETHQAECSAAAVLEGRGIGLGCPKTKQLCCYVGEEKAVADAMEQLEIRAEKEKSETPESFTDNVIMYEVLSELKDIAARGGISCGCGSRAYRIRVQRDAVDLVCSDCGSRLRLPAATDEDLDRLCCQMKLVIPGK